MTRPHLRAQIANEIYIAMERLGADPNLLSIVGSYGDTLDDGKTPCTRCCSYCGCPYGKYQKLTVGGFRADRGRRPNYDALRTTSCPWSAGPAEHNRKHRWARTAEPELYNGEQCCGAAKQQTLPSPATPAKPRRSPPTA